MATSSSSFLNLFILLSLALAVRSDDYECVYTVYIRTGSVVKAGTDSKIDVELWTAKGDGVHISNIETWGGLMGSNYDYFERGQLDIFSGRGPCLNGPVCGLKLISDGTGPHHGWYCNYVEVTTTKVHEGCAQQRFDVEQWLALDAAPYELTATRNVCPNSETLTRSMSSEFIPLMKPSVASS